jgi:hypothetical protein
MQNLTLSGRGLSALLRDQEGTACKVRPQLLSSRHNARRSSKRSRGEARLWLLFLYKTDLWPPPDICLLPEPMTSTFSRDLFLLLRVSGSVTSQLFILKPSRQQDTGNLITVAAQDRILRILRLHAASRADNRSDRRPPCVLDM